MLAPMAGRASSCSGAARSAAMSRYASVIYLGYMAHRVSTSDVAARLGVATPSVSAMLRRLNAAGLLAESCSGGITLTEHGHRHARDVIRRHAPVGA